MDRGSSVNVRLQTPLPANRANVRRDSPRFYKKVGLGAHAFDYNIASATAGWAGCLLGMIASDIVGRRDLLIWGCITFSLFLFLVSGLGLHAHPSPSEARGLVASVVLYIFIFTGLVALPYRFGATHADKTVQNSGSNFVCCKYNYYSHCMAWAPNNLLRLLQKFRLRP